MVVPGNDGGQTDCTIGVRMNHEVRFPREHGEDSGDAVDQTHSPPLRYAEAILQATVDLRER